jgi:hypothetical protein
MASRRFALIFVIAAGCSTHPLVDICDTLQPGHLYPNKVTPYGGVCIPQGAAIQGTAPSAPFGPVVPPPVPLPPTGPAVSVPTLPVPLPPTNLPPSFPPPR